jgi:hypothetical protein
MTEEDLSTPDLSTPELDALIGTIVEIVRRSPHEMTRVDVAIACMAEDCSRQSVRGVCRALLDGAMRVDPGAATVALRRYRERAVRGGQP